MGCSFELEAMKKNGVHLKKNEKKENERWGKEECLMTYC